MKQGYYNEKQIRKFASALNDAKRDVKAGTETRIRISSQNSKMGPVASVSLLPYLTCPDCVATSCGPKCYAARFATRRPGTLRAWAINTALALFKPNEFWKQIAEFVQGVRFFRFHVGGEMPTKAYLHHVVDVATATPKTDFLMFTKRFDWVNEWIDKNGPLPENLHILFSAWQGLEPENPHNMPETNVYSCADEIRDDWKQCGGCCFNCACRGVGCWQAKHGDTIAFKIH